MATQEDKTIQTIKSRLKAGSKNESLRNQNLKDFRAMYNNTYTSEMMEETTDAQIHIPKAHGIVESVVARICANDPQGDYKPVNDTFKANNTLLTSLFQHQWHIAQMPLQLLAAAKRGEVDGTIIARMVWKYEERDVWNREKKTTESKVVRDSWDYILEKRENCYLNPSAEGIKAYHKNGEWIIISVIESLSDLKNRTDKDGAIKYKNLKKLEDWLKEGGEKAPTAKHQSDTSMNENSETQQHNAGSVADKYDSTTDKVNVLYHYTYKQWHGFVPGFSDENGLILDTKNPNGDGELPVLVSYTNIDDDSVDGISSVAIGADSFDSLNTLASQQLDAGSYDMLPIIQAKGYDKTEKIDWSRGNIIYSRMDQEIVPVPSPNRSQNTFQLQWQYLNQAIEAGLGYVDNAKQAGDATASQSTATGVRSSDVERDLKISKKIKIFEKTLIEPLAEKALKMSYRYLDEPMTIGLSDKRAIKYFKTMQEADDALPENQRKMRVVIDGSKPKPKFRIDDEAKNAFLTITPEDLYGDYVFEADTEASLTNSEAEVNKLAQFTDFLLNDKVEAGLLREKKAISFSELVERRANALGIKNEQELIVNIEEQMLQNGIDPNSVDPNAMNPQAMGGNMAGMQPNPMQMPQPAPMQMQQPQMPLNPQMMQPQMQPQGMPMMNQNVQNYMQAMQQGMLRVGDPRFINDQDYLQAEQLLQQGQ
jgi:hypothetical protein